MAVAPLVFLRNFRICDMVFPFGLLGKIDYPLAPIESGLSRLAG
jgi:hypothetical protein